MPTIHCELSIDEIVETIRQALVNTGHYRTGDEHSNEAEADAEDGKLPIEIRRAFSEAQAASYLNVSISNLRKLRMNKGRKGHMPPVPYVVLGRRISYLRDDLDKILVANRVETSQ
jgi:hypothetical protein